MGFDSQVAKSLRAASTKLNEYVKPIARIPGAVEVTVKDISGYHLAPNNFLTYWDQVIELLGQEVRDIQ